MPPWRRQINDRLGRQPAFVEESRPWSNELPEQELVVPPTINALLAARLDQLDDGEQRVLSAAAVEG